MIRYIKGHRAEAKCEENHVSLLFNHHLVATVPYSSRPYESLNVYLTRILAEMVDEELSKASQQLNGGELPPPRHF